MQDDILNDTLNDQGRGELPDKGEEGGGGICILCWLQCCGTSQAGAQSHTQG